MPFKDADTEIEKALPHHLGDLRALRRTRLPRRRTPCDRSPPLRGPHVLATGGGAFMDAKTREAIKDHAVSIWIKAPVEILLERVVLLIARFLSKATRAKRWSVC
ncbi:MAG: shikimate kinase [Pseudomonas sp.]